MNLKTYSIEIESLSPLLMDQWVESKTQPKTEDEYKKMAELKAYKDAKGNLIIPRHAIKASMREAAADLVGIRKGKGMRQTIAASIFIDEDLGLGRKEHDGLRKDIVKRTTGKQATRVATYRPMINEWKGKFVVKCLDVGLSGDFVKQAFELAGIKYGLLGYRPEFGRFTVKNFKEVKA